jgi:hypothetical protein
MLLMLRLHPKHKHHQKNKFLINKKKQNLCITTLDVLIKINGSKILLSLICVVSENESKRMLKDKETCKN